MVRTLHAVGDVEHYQHAMTPPGLAFLLNLQHTIKSGEEGCSEMHGLMRDRSFESSAPAKSQANSARGHAKFGRSSRVWLCCLHRTVRVPADGTRRSRNSRSSTSRPRRRDFGRWAPHQPAWEDPPPASLHVSQADKGQVPDVFKLTLS